MATTQWSASHNCIFTACTAALTFDFWGHWPSYMQHSASNVQQAMRITQLITTTWQRGSRHGEWTPRTAASTSACKSSARPTRHVPNWGCSTAKAPAQLCMSYKTVLIAGIDAIKYLELNIHEHIWDTETKGHFAEAIYRAFPISLGRW